MSTQPATTPRYNRIDLADEMVAKIDWLLVAKEMDWSPLVEYLVNLEAARMGYKVPVERKADDHVL